MEKQKVKSPVGGRHSDEAAGKPIRNLSYKELWRLCKSKTDIRIKAAEEIRMRKTLGALPEIKNNCPVSQLTDWQREIFSWLKEALPSRAELILTVQYIQGGWVVYLTGEDRKIIQDKIKLIAESVEQEIKEFGNCRVIAIPYSRYPGLKIVYDRGLRCPFPKE